MSSVNVKYRPKIMFPLKMNRLTDTDQRINPMISGETDTERLVQTMLDYLKCKEVPHNAGDWPIDAECNTKLKDNLSYSKMINVLNHSAPRSFNDDGII